MTDLEGDDGPGRFEARYLAFLETIPQLRPGLIRYCARMTGSVLDGEDVVQDALFHAYRKLDTFDEARPLGPWLFRIAHNRCIDFLRRKGVRVDAEQEIAAPPTVAPVDPPGPALGRAVEHLVLALPPMERACVLLKDVFDYSLEETAELVDSTVGGVKSALNRGRDKLAAGEPARRPAPPVNPEAAHILRLYVDRFNRRDWDGLKTLIAADARLLVADAFAGRLDRSPYFGNYDRLKMAWRLVPAVLDGEDVIAVLHRRDDGGWYAKYCVRLEIAGDGRITRIADYGHTPWVRELASGLVVEPLPA